MTFTQDRIRFIAIESGLVPTLAMAGESQLHSAFDFSACKDGTQISRQAAAVEALMDRQGVASGRVFFAVDQSCLLLKRLRVDRVLSESELRQHIEWEMEQLLVDPRDEFNVSYERIRSDDERFQHLAVAAMRKSIIRHLESIFAKTRLELKIIDVDVLSAQRGLVAAVNKIAEGLSAMIQVVDGKVCFSLMKNSGFLSTHVTTLRPEQRLSTTRPMEVDEVAGFIHDELLRLLDTLGDEVLLKTIDQLFVIDKGISHEVMVALQLLLRTAEIVLVDPLQKLRHTLNPEAQSLVRERAGSFLPLIGLYF